ncbi:YonK family protein [Bacillus sp. Marseille-P3800]|uniref:YonK family protein n=1 Tax=Bacillus sp. Marseille-P3800 TaxID=2014782 RepID=UPI000C07801B|nr:YonK family protein [Bacillus sp. Marseille-P3800]
MAKFTNTTALKGLLDIDTDGAMTVEEEIKDETKTYDLFAILKRYNGREVSINIKEEEPVQELVD